MFRDLKRHEQKLSFDEIEYILKDSSSGVLSLNGSDGYPYGVPVSFIYLDNKIYIHSKKDGYKIDCINKSSKASFTIIYKDQVSKIKFNTDFQSIIAYGIINIMENEKEIIYVLYKFAEKYKTASSDEIMAEINKFMNRLALLEFDIEHITGKESYDLAKSKNKISQEY